MIDFKWALEQKILEMAQTVVGVGTDPNDYVKTFDNHLHDFNLDFTPDPWPTVVVLVRSMERQSSSELGIDYDLYEWTVHLYYIDVVNTEETPFTDADKRRDIILGKLVKYFEQHRTLNSLQRVAGDGSREYVYDSELPAAIFDYSGQEGSMSFVTELHMRVFTAKG